jgi:hypothetical protein
MANVRLSAAVLEQTRDAVIVAELSGGRRPAS